MLVYDFIFLFGTCVGSVVKCLNYNIYFNNFTLSVPHILF